MDEVGITGCLTAEHWPRDARHIQELGRRGSRGYIKILDIPRGKQFKDFSRGNKMKLGIAAALSHGQSSSYSTRRRAALTPSCATRCWISCATSRAMRSTSVLMSSHIVSDLEKACDYIAFLHRGGCCCARRRTGFMRNTAYSAARRHSCISRPALCLAAHVALRRGGEAARPRRARS